MLVLRQMQLNDNSSFLQLLSASQDPTIAALDSLAAQLDGSPFNVMATPSQIAAFQSQLSQTGLPLVEKDSLKLFGFTDSQIDAITDELASADITGPLSFASVATRSSDAVALYAAIAQSVSTVPEPGALLLLASGLVGLSAVMWRHKRRRNAGILRLLVADA